MSKQEQSSYVSTTITPTDNVQQKAATTSSSTFSSNFQDLLFDNRWEVIDQQTNASGDLTVVFLNKVNGDTTTFHNVNPEHFLKLWRESDITMNVEEGDDPMDQDNDDDNDSHRMKEIDKQINHLLAHLSCDKMDQKDLSQLRSFVSLTDDHYHLLDLYQQYLKASEAPKKRAIIDQLIRDLVRHTVIERQLVCPVVQSVLPDGIRICNEMSEEQDRIMTSFRSIQETDTNDHNFKELCDALMVDLRNHIERMENFILPKLQKYLNTEQIEIFVSIIANAKRIVESDQFNPQKLFMLSDVDLQLKQFLSNRVV